MKEFVKIILSLALGFVLCFLTLRGCRDNVNGSEMRTDVIIDTLRVFDTVVVRVPVPIDSVVVRYVAETLPVVPENIKNNEKRADSVLKKPEIVPEDSANVIIPISRKIYETEQYRAFVSGYKANLDSLFIVQPTKIVRVRQTPKRWNIGVQLGYGLTLENQPQFCPYLGVGVTYSIFSF